MVLKVKRALVSVSDKTGLVDFVRGLREFDVEILSTGGTAAALEKAGVPVRHVSDYTGSPEVLDGRVKTLHPKIHGSLLALRRNPEHVRQVKEHGFELIDMVVVNLYPFEKTVENEGVEMAEAVENIDIGGPSMLRSAAKNFTDVAVICDPARYAGVLDEMKKNGGCIPGGLLMALAQEVFDRTSGYDSAIQSFLRSRLSGREEALFPGTLGMTFTKVQDLRYGENPHQKAAFYRSAGKIPPSVASAKQLHGKELSYNNIMDLDAALSVVSEFSETSAVIVKHTNPCGTASAGTLKRAYSDALDCDRLSAFGGIVGLNTSVDVETAAEIASSGFVECVAAPGFAGEALALLRGKKNIRLLEVPGFSGGCPAQGRGFRFVLGGALFQELDAGDFPDSQLKVVTARKPGREELESLKFAWKVAKHVTSNAIVLANGTKTVGVGAGQMSRVDSCRIAVEKAGEKAKGSVAASDAFFPKPDGVEALAKAGVTAIIQPGGSLQDDAAVETADALGMSMVFTGMRHFRH